MIISNVKLMTAEEVSNFKMSLYKGDEKKQESAKYCADNLKLLCQKHDEFYNYLTDEYYRLYLEKKNAYSSAIIESNEIYLSVKSGKDKFCTCGAKLRYISNFDFVGCSNFKDQTLQHCNFNYKEPIEILTKRDFIKQTEIFGQNYLSKFKKWLKIEFVSTSVLYEFLFTVAGLKPYFAIDTSKYNTILNSKTDSKTQESVLKELLKTKYKTVLDQPHFRCDINDVSSVRIPDFICSFVAFV